MTLFGWSGVFERLAYAAGTVVFTLVVYAGIYMFLRMVGLLSTIKRAVSRLKSRRRAGIPFVLMMLPLWLNYRRQTMLEIIGGLDWAAIGIGLAGMVLFGVSGFLVVLAFITGGDAEESDASDADTNRSDGVEGGNDDETHW